MKSIILFLFYSHYLASASHSSASSTVDASQKKTALLVRFKKVLTGAKEYKYDEAEWGIVNPGISQSEDLVVTTSQTIIRVFTARTQHKNIWGQVLGNLALTNSHFDGILSNNVFVKSLRFLEYILSVFEIPNDLNKYKASTLTTSEAEAVTRECLRELFQDYLGEVLPEKFTNMLAVIVFLYIHTMQGKINIPSINHNSSTSEQPVYKDNYEQYNPHSNSDCSANNKPKIRYHSLKFKTASNEPVQSLKKSNVSLVTPNVCSNNNAVPSRAQEKEKQGIIVLEATGFVDVDKEESKTAADKVTQASTSDVEEELAASTYEEKESILDMLEKNSDRLIFEDQVDRYKDIDILPDAQNT